MSGKLVRVALFAASAMAMLPLFGCPPAADVKQPPAITADSLPTEPAALLKVADEQLAQGGWKNAVTALDRAVQKNPDWAASKASFEAHYRLAHAYAELCEPDGDQRGTFVSQGLAAGKKAVELEPGRVEGHYFLAQLYGYAALSQKGETKAQVQQILSTGEAAAKADEKYDHGGPLRLLGTLYARAPKEPVSIGDTEKAVQYLRRAVAADDSFPPNHIYLADALIADERYPDAEAELQSARRLLDDPRYASHRAPWKELLGKVERKLRAKQG